MNRAFLGPLLIENRCTIRTAKCGFLRLATVNLDRHEPYSTSTSTCTCIRQGSKKVTYRQGGIAVTRGLAKRLNSIHKGLITAHNMRTSHPEMKCLSRQGQARKNSGQSARAHQATRLHRCYMSVDTRLLADSRFPRGEHKEIGS